MAEVPQPQKVRVLLLEDNPLDADLVVARLKRAGLEFEIARAEDRQSFLEHLHGRAFDLILADYALPDFDGLSALDAARALYPHLPFIFISGRVGEEVAIDTVQRGATDYVLKQRLERLVPAVTRALKEADERARRMRVEQRFRESETRFRDVMDALPQLVWVSTTKGEQLYTNKAWVEHVPAGAASWLDPHVVHASDLAACSSAWERAVAARQAFSCECRLKVVDTEDYRWHLIRMVPLLGGQLAAGQAGVDWLGTATDLQEQKLNEEALRTAEKLAVTGRMIATIAHEINNPLESLSNLIYLARLEAKGSPRACDYLDMTENELARVSAITKQTLQFYRDPLAPTEVDAREILEDVQRLFATRLASKRIAFSLHVEGSIVFQAIKGEIRQVLINLVGNAIDAVSHGGAIEALACPSQQGDREMVEVRICDNGAGIAEAQRERLFHPFVSSKGAYGTGLGLWVSKGIVEKHAGSISLDSCWESEANSTVATVLLPLRASGELVADHAP